MKNTEISYSHNNIFITFFLEPFLVSLKKGKDNGENIIMLSILIQSINKTT